MSTSVLDPLGRYCVHCGMCASTTDADFPKSGSLLFSLHTVCSFFFSSRRRHTRSLCDWSSDVCSSDLEHMKAQGAFYDPTLSVGEGFRDFAAGKGDLLKRSLVQQVATADLLKGTEEALARSEERRVGKECRSRWWPYH